MQRYNKKNEYLTKILGELIEELRLKKQTSGRKFSDEFDLSRSNLSKIERGLIFAKFATIFKISQALGYKFSDFAMLLEKNSALILV